MGAGFALALKNKYLWAYNDYRNRHYEVGLKLGDVVTACQYEPLHSNNLLCVFNAITQELYGREQGKLYCSYEAIERCFQAIDVTMGSLPKAQGLQQVAMPMIGAGLAGGEWERIESIIEANSENYQPVVYKL
jgi:O-acetyl-ADP-ribose deacetylase (regulator of RNase III)